MDALPLLEDLANDAMQRERVFRDREDFLAHDDDWLLSRFQFPRAIPQNVAVHSTKQTPDCARTALQ